MDHQMIALLQSVRVEIDIVDLFDFAEGSIRNWKEGNEVFKNNHVIVAGVNKIVGDSVHIFCSCLRGSNPSEPPREIKMVTSKLLKDWEIWCSCPAGNYRCKHQFACLLFIHRNKDLEILSATDVRQQWGKVAKIQAEALYEPVPLSGLCNQHKKETSTTISNELSSSIFNLFISELPTSALAKSIAGRNTLRPIANEIASSSGQQTEVLPQLLDQNLPEWNPVQDRPVNTTDAEEIKMAQDYLRPFISKSSLTMKWKYYQGPLLHSNLHLFYEYRVCVSSEESLSICAKTHDQCNDVWRRERRIRITASECYDLYTYYLNDSGDRDWNKKLSSIIHPLEKRLSPLMFGKEMEGRALASYKMKNPGKKVIKMGLVIPPSAPFLGCSPDAIVVDEAKLVEIKCPFLGKDKPIAEVIDTLKWVEKNNGVYKLRKKHAYYGQVQLVPYIPREAWDAKPPKSVEKFAGPIPYVIIHHSYQPGACLTGSECCEAMLSMQKFHQQDRGWNDIGYSFAVGGDGRVYEGRGFNVVGAHAPRYNDKSVGICMIGDWTVDLPPENMIAAAQNLIEYGVRNNIIASNYTLIGHRQVRPTECPGERLFKEIQTWPHYSSMLDVVDPNSIRT